MASHLMAHIGKYTLAALLSVAMGALTLVLVATDSTQATASSSGGQPAGGSAGKYSVFDRPATTASDETRGWRARQDPGPRENFGLRFAEARVIQRDGGTAVAAVPASNGSPCLAVQYKDGSGGLSCGGPGTTAALVGYNGATGIVPDSVQTVTFTLTDGTTQTSQVEGNVWRSPPEAAKVTFMLGDRVEEIELMPRSSLPEGATITDSGVVTSASPGQGG